jgi:hypothetical protein
MSGILLITFIPLAVVTFISVAWTRLLHRAMKRASDDTSWAYDDLKKARRDRDTLTRTGRKAIKP